MLSPEELEMLFLRGKTRFQTYELEARPSKSVEAMWKTQAPEEKLPIFHAVLLLEC